MLDNVSTRPATQLGGKLTGICESSCILVVPVIDGLQDCGDPHQRGPQPGSLAHGIDGGVALGRCIVRFLGSSPMIKFRTCSVTNQGYSDTILS